MPSLFSLFTVFPMLRVLSQVHNASNDNSFVANGINNGEGKAIGQITAETGEENGPCGWMLFYPFKPSPNFGRKFVSQTRTLVVVIIDRLDQFLLCTGENDQIHRSEIRLKTSSAGEAEIFPASKASTRDSTSVAQALSTVDFGEESKLIKRRSMSSARSTGGSSSALSMIFSATAVMSSLR